MVGISCVNVYKHNLHIIVDMLPVIYVDLSDW